MRKPRVVRPRMALAAARDVVRQVCRCGHFRSDHGALHPDAEPGEKLVGLGICYGGDREPGDAAVCGCQRFRRAKLRVEAA